MKLASAHVSISTRRKLTSILLAVIIFALLAGLTSFATRGSVVYAIIDSILVGIGVGLFDAGGGCAACTRCCRLRSIPRL
jgi:hypothetical protein